MGGIETTARVLKMRFGDEQSTLLDRYERLSFEVQLNQAILGRSRSEPASRPPPPPPPLSHLPTAILVTHHPHHHHSIPPTRRCRSGLSRLDKLLKKLLKPILGRKPRPRPMDSRPQAGAAYSMPFTRSVSVRI